MGSRFNYLTSDGPAACAIERRAGYRVYPGKVNGTDEDVMRAVSESGDEASLMTGDERHADELFGFALNRLRDRRLAEDFVQDVFVRVWSRADADDVERGNFRSWLYRIARDYLTDLKRRRGSAPS
jgi:RNA polymerase sigma-70 factor (ECF subfamily)